METIKLPGGVLTASLTPLNRSLNPDHPRLVKHLKWLLDRGNNGIALLGTTGEANSFSVPERIEILDATIDGGIAPEKLIVGTGCCAITDTVMLTRHAHAYKVGGILLLPPFYYKQVSDMGLENYFTELLDRLGENDVRIYLYHFPQLTGIPFSIKLIEKLVSRFPDNIIGMKDSGGEWAHMEETLRTIPGFRVYAGSEKFLLDILKAGGAGCISASANLTSPEAAAVYEAWKKGGGEKEQERVSVLRAVLEKYPAIGTLKYLFARMTGDHDWLNIRPPNVLLNEAEGAQIVNILNEIEYQF